MKALFQKGAGIAVAAVRGRLAAMRWWWWLGRRQGYCRAPSTRAQVLL